MDGREPAEDSANPQAPGWTRAFQPGSRWLGVWFLAMTIVLAVWTIWLTIRLPSRHLAAHWDLAWGGFDAMLTLALAATAIAALRGDLWLVQAATVTATLLVVDAWFDVATAGESGVRGSLAAALLIELPVAVFCVLAAIATKRAERALVGPPGRMPRQDGVTPSR